MGYPRCGCGRVVRELNWRERMPKRQIDGEALWKSGKVKTLKENLRMHYANWLPLAEANGTFEADPERIRSQVYSYLLPGLSIPRVAEILEAFKSAGLVKT